MTEKFVSILTWPVVRSRSAKFQAMWDHSKSDRAAPKKYQSFRDPKIRTAARKKKEKIELAKLGIEPRLSAWGLQHSHVAKACDPWVLIADQRLSR